MLIQPVRDDTNRLIALRLYYPEPEEVKLMARMVEQGAELVLDDDALVSTGLWKKCISLLIKRLSI